MMPRNHLGFWGQKEDTLGDRSEEGFYYLVPDYFDLYLSDNSVFTW